MTRQTSRHLLLTHSPLRRATVTSRHCGWVLAGVVALHIALVAGIWRAPAPSLPEKPTTVVLQLTAAPRPSAPVVKPAPIVAPVSPPQPASPPKPKVKPAASARHRAPAARATHSAHSREAAMSPPPAGDMLGNALASVHQQNWQDTSQRYAQDSVSGVQSALARYRQDWVRTTQTYVDLHFPKTRRNARLEFDVTVDRYGKLVGLDMVHSTGDVALDAQAFKAVRAAAPFRPFDAGMGNRQTLTFRQGWVFNQGALLEP